MRRVRGLAIDGGRGHFAERRDCTDLASALAAVTDELKTRARLPVGTPVALALAAELVRVTRVSVPIGAAGVISPKALRSLCRTEIEAWLLVVGDKLADYVVDCFATEYTDTRVHALVVAINKAVIRPLVDVLRANHLEPWLCDVDILAASVALGPLCGICDDKATLLHRRLEDHCAVTLVRAGKVRFARSYRCQNDAGQGRQLGIAQKVADRILCYEGCAAGSESMQLGAITSGFELEGRAEGIDAALAPLFGLLHRLDGASGVDLLHSEPVAHVASLFLGPAIVGGMCLIAIMLTLVSVRLARDSAATHRQMLAALDDGERVYREAGFATGAVDPQQRLVNLEAVASRLARWGEPRVATHTLWIELLEVIERWQLAKERRWQLTHLSVDEQSIALEASIETDEDERDLCHALESFVGRRPSVLHPAEHRRERAQDGAGWAFTCRLKRRESSK